MSEEATDLSRRSALVYTDACDLARDEATGEVNPARTVTLLTTALGIAMAEQLHGLEGTGHVEHSLQVIAQLVVRATVYQLTLRRLKTP